MTFSMKYFVSCESCLTILEHILSIIYWLMRNIPSVSISSAAPAVTSSDEPSAVAPTQQPVQQRVRLMNKWVERDMEKVDRLMELHFKYAQRVNNCDRKIDRQRRVSTEAGRGHY